MTGFTRRQLGGGLAAVIGLVLAGGVFYEGRRLLGRHYPPSPFDDLLSRLHDRDAAAKLGTAVLAATPGFDATRVAAQLRRTLGSGNLPKALTNDIAQGRLVTVQGWLVPETLVLLSGLAAEAARR